MYFFPTEPTEFTEPSVRLSVSSVNSVGDYHFFPTEPTEFTEPSAGFFREFCESLGDYHFFPLNPRNSEPSALLSVSSANSVGDSLSRMFRVFCEFCGRLSFFPTEPTEFTEPSAGFFCVFCEFCGRFFQQNVPCVLRILWEIIISSHGTHGIHRIFSWLFL